MAKKVHATTRQPRPISSLDDVGLDVIRRLRSAGLKATPQRICILKELLSRTDHPSAETLYNAVKEKYPTISFNTIYNTLQILTTKELIKAIRPLVDATRYDSVTELHGHFICSRCKNIEDHALEDPALKRIDSEVKQCGRYWMVQSQVLWIGVCSTCKQQARQ